MRRRLTLSTKTDMTARLAHIHESAKALELAKHVSVKEINEAGRLIAYLAVLVHGHLTTDEK